LNCAGANRGIGSRLGHTFSTGVFAYPREKVQSRITAPKQRTVPIRTSANSRRISSRLAGREPMRVEEADPLCNAYKTTEEKLVHWTLLDTGLRVSELLSQSPKPDTPAPDERSMTPSSAAYRSSTSCAKRRATRARSAARRQLGVQRTQHAQHRF
jgi:hypothetical protein